jgi:MerR family transcriptional regulator, copper efflux regulator
VTEQQLTGGGEAGPPPVACTLTPGDLAARAGQWRALISRAVTGRAEFPDGLRLMFRDGAGTEAELRGLAAAENECCPWASWTVEAAGGQLALTIRAATADGAATLRAMFAGPA